MARERELEVDPALELPVDADLVAHPSGRAFANVELDTSSLTVSAIGQPVGWLNFSAPLPPSEPERSGTAGGSCALMSVERAHGTDTSR